MNYNDYRQLVERLKKTKSKNTIKNGEIEKVQILLENLIDYAKNSINIYSGKLTKVIWGDKVISEKFQTFLEEKKGELKILVDENPEITTYNKHTKKIKNKLKDAGHFITIDKLAIRLEKINLTEKDEEASAIACFNNKGVNEALRKLFDSEYLQATAI